MQNRCPVFFGKVLKILQPLDNGFVFDFQGPAGCFFKQKIVDGDIKRGGELCQDLGRRGDVSVFVATDLPGIATDFFGKLALGPALFFST